MPYGDPAAVYSTTAGLVLNVAVPSAPAIVRVDVTETVVDASHCPS